MNLLEDQELPIAKQIKRRPTNQLPIASLYIDNNSSINTNNLSHYMYDYITSIPFENILIFILTLLQIIFYIVIICTIKQNNQNMSIKAIKIRNDLFITNIVFVSVNLLFLFLYLIKINLLFFPIFINFLYSLIIFN
jgi:hypothetical protein